jgi:hypothetical protein
MHDGTIPAVELQAVYRIDLMFAWACFLTLIALNFVSGLVREEVVCTTGNGRPVYAPMPMVQVHPTVFWAAQGLFLAGDLLSRACELRGATDRSALAPPAARHRTAAGVAGERDLRAPGAGRAGGRGGAAAVRLLSGTGTAKGPGETRFPGPSSSILRQRLYAAAVGLQKKSCAGSTFSGSKPRSIRGNTSAR